MRISCICQCVLTNRNEGVSMKANLAELELPMVGTLDAMSCEDTIFRSCLLVIATQRESALQIW